MKLVVGLGNPGPRYADTRHNVGFRVVERLAARCGVVLSEHRFHGRYGSGWLPGAGAEPVALGLLEPETFMNRSGAAVAQAVAELPGVDPAADLLVVLDDLDLPFGRLRLRASGGSGGQRGLADAIAALGRQDFARLRFGVGRPEGDEEATDWLLSRFWPDEAVRLEGLLEAAAEAALVALNEGVPAAMNRFNRDPAAEPASG